MRKHKKKPADPEEWRGILTVLRTIPKPQSHSSPEPTPRDSQQTPRSLLSKIRAQESRASCRDEDFHSTMFDEIFTQDLSVNQRFDRYVQRCSLEKLARRNLKLDEQREREKVNEAGEERAERRRLSSVQVQWCGVKVRDLDRRREPERKPVQRTYERRDKPRRAMPIDKVRIDGKRVDFNNSDNFTLIK